MESLKKQNLFASCLLVIVMLFLVSLFPIAADYPEEVMAAKKSITGPMVVSHIHFLASKYCRGRETGDYGMDVADKYISSVLYGSEVTPAGDMGSYFQQVRLKSVALSENVYLKLTDQSGGAPLIQDAQLEFDYLPINISAEREVNGSVVFAGYGITAPEHNYDDYKNINAKGKIVLVMRHEPGENDDKSPFEGRKLSKYGTFLTKILNAQKHGAVGILFVTDPMNHEDLSLEGGYFSGTSWPSLQKKRMKDDEDFKYHRFRSRFRIIGDDFGVKIPAIFIDGDFAKNLLGEKISLLQIQKEIDKSLKPNSFTIPGKKIRMRVDFKTQFIKANNIVFKVEGSDPALKNEVVIVGAHYDHEGKDNRGRVYGGADDNASGSAGVIELARAFKKLKVKPKRTILFILFTAEEKGLLGARYYVKNPLFPLKKTIAMVNLDMIGRNEVDQISLVGKYQYPKLFNIVDKANKKSVNFDINFSVESFIRNSDHFPFMREKIPSIFFNSGSHDQLHTPEDTVGRIIVEKVEKVVQLVFLILWDTANLPAGTQLK
jgi:hypothetical protein